jgi:Holliday junction resolvasome RuvABC endonuclease subunit
MEQSVLLSATHRRRAVSSGPQRRPLPVEEIVTIKWPKGCEDFYRFVALNKALILSGTVLAIDPSTTSPGFALFENGQLIIKGVLKVDAKRPAFQRLQQLPDLIKAICKDAPDVVAVEKVPKAAAHVYLLYGVGATIAAARTPRVIDVDIPVWKAVAQTDPVYTKTDANDAEKIGQSLIYRALQLTSETA